MSKPAVVVQIRIDPLNGACQAAWSQENVIVDNAYDFETFDHALHTVGHTQYWNAVMIDAVADFINGLRNSVRKRPNNADTRHEFSGAFAANQCIIGANNSLTHYCHSNEISILARNLNTGHVAIAEDKYIFAYLSYFNGSARDYVSFVNMWQLVTGGTAFTESELAIIAQELTAKK